MSSITIKDVRANKGTPSAEVPYANRFGTVGFTEVSDVGSRPPHPEVLAMWLSEEATRRLVHNCFHGGVDPEGFEAASFMPTDGYPHGGLIVYKMGSIACLVPRSQDAQERYASFVAQVRELAS